MKKHLGLRLFCFLFLFIFSGFYLVHGQDKIVMLNQDTLNRVIIRMTPDTIFYADQQKPDSVIQLSTSFVRKIIYRDGKEEFVEHVYNRNRKNILLSNSNELLIKGNKYVFKGITIRHTKLGILYTPLKDSLLNDLYLRGMILKTSSTILKFTPIPLGVIGFGLASVSTLPTSSDHNGGHLKYGNKNLLVPGFVLMGTALIVGMISIATHKSYNRLLNKSALRYNEIIRKHELN